MWAGSGDDSGLVGRDNDFSGWRCLKIGSAIEVRILAAGVPTDIWVPGTVREVRRNHQTQCITSVRVRALICGRVRFCWVRSRFVRPREEAGVTTILSGGAD